MADVRLTFARSKMFADGMELDPDHVHELVADQAPTINGTNFFMEVVADGEVIAVREDCDDMEAWKLSGSGALYDQLKVEVA